MTRQVRFLVPPDEIVADQVVLRRWSPSQVGAMVAAVAESREHLKPWMPWAQKPLDERTYADLVARAQESFQAGREFAYAMFPPDDASKVVGSCGLHARRGPDTLEIGYWVHVDHGGRGLATAAADALTSVAFDLGATRVEIRCDEANLPSAAVARKAGFTLQGVRDREPEAPGHSGREMVWVKTRST
ncbi:MAG TPA: GNAT family protein [Actinomycetota bacterium]|nr:GNAT family protein [Actinomycetota bacterium]